MMNVNMHHIFWYLEYYFLYYLNQINAQILNVVSVAGYEIPVGFYHTTYTATKYALQGYTEGMAKEFENRNLE
jgi:short-subunit dehydrogenase